jgi:hypothetical protein
MFVLCYSKYEVYPDGGVHWKGGDAMVRAPFGRKSVHAQSTASKEMYLFKPPL